MNDLLILINHLLILEIALFVHFGLPYTCTYHANRCYCLSVERFIQFKKLLFIRSILKMIDGKYIKLVFISKYNSF